MYYIYILPCIYLFIAMYYLYITIYIYVYAYNKQLKKRETFWQHKLKTSDPHGLNKKGEYLL